MEKYLLRLLMQYDFYQGNKNKILPEFFPHHMQNLYKLIIATVEKNQQDLTLEELKALYKVTYPATTKAQWDLLEQILDDIPGELREDVSKEVLQKAFLLEQGRQIAEIGINICNGKSADIQKVREILQKIDAGVISYGSDDDFEPVCAELELILEALNVTTKWHFNLAPLKAVCSGIGPGIFTIVAARVETGKTAFGVSICAAPEGLAEQGALCHFYCNEENPQRTQGRAVMAYTGMPYQELVLTPDIAKERYLRVKDKIKFFDCRGKSIYDIEAHINKHRPDIGVIDQLDKLSIRGSYTREDERLGALYSTARDVGTKYSSALLAITQLNAEADGKTYVSSVNLAHARTSKAAEGDLVLGIGKSAAHDECVRIINIIKNKITGNHQEVVCMIKPEISRFVA